MPNDKNKNQQKLQVESGKTEATSSVEVSIVHWKSILLGMGVGFILLLLLLVTGVRFSEIRLFGLRLDFLTPFPVKTATNADVNTPVPPTLPALIYTEDPRAFVDVGNLYIFAVDKETGVSLPDADVTVRTSSGYTMETRTNSAGMAFFRLAYYHGSELVDITVYKSGYEAVPFSQYYGDLSIYLQSGSSKVIYLQARKGALPGTGGGEDPDTPTPGPSPTPVVIKPNSPVLLDVAFYEIDSQFQNTLKSNIAFNKPEQMRKGETTSIELIVNPSLSELALATQVVERGDFATSTAEPNVLIGPYGERVMVQTNQIDITPRMKAVLLPQDPDAFTVKEMHDNAEQVVSSVETTAWRWSVTAKKEGSQTLELVISQLVKYDGKDFWHEVETYKANIVVEVTPLDRVKSLDWKWIAGFIIALVGSVLGVLNWLNNRKKKFEEEKPVQSPKKKKKQP